MNPRKDYQAALALRMEGKTYGEISSHFGIPKSTLSNWFSGLQLKNEVVRILELKRKAGYFKLLEFNRVRTKKIAQENESIRKSFESKIVRLDTRELMILGSALYWGEGYKNFRPKRGYPYISFGNSDPLMHKAFIVFLEKILEIHRAKIKAQIMLYPGINAAKAVRYWHKMTEIPTQNFRTQLTVSRSSQGKRPWNLLPHGTLQLRIHKRGEFFKIRGLIDGIIKSI